MLLCGSGKLNKLSTLKNALSHKLGCSLWHSRKILHLFLASAMLVPMLVLAFVVNGTFTWLL